MRSRSVIIAVCMVLLPVATAQPAPLAANPEQLHVALGEEPGTLVVQWALVGSEYGPADEPEVAWRLDDGVQMHTSASLAGTVRDWDLDTSVYAATIGPLPGGAMVSYHVGEADHGYSTERMVRMTPGADAALRFVAYADIGYDGVHDDGSADEDSAPRLVRDAALSHAPDLLVIPGDLSYDNNRDEWDRFMRFMEPIQSAVATMPAIGNHEWDEDDGYGYGQFLAEYVLPPDEQSFAFSAGPVDFVVANSDAVCSDRDRVDPGSATDPCDDGAPNGTATGRLDEILAAVTADDGRPWTVVYFHHPPYSWGHHGSDMAVRSLWSPLLERHGVDLVLSGHDHLYGRSHAVVDESVTDGQSPYRKGAGPLYVVVGGGGRELHELPMGSPPDWHAIGHKRHHFLLVEATQDQLSIRAVAADDAAVLDEFVIRKDAAAEGAGPSAPIPTLPLLVALAGLVAVGIRRRRRP